MKNILKNEGDRMELRKVGIIGVGHVGAHVAYALLLQGIADELVLISKDEVKLTSQVQDLNDAVPYAKQKCYVHAGTFQDLGNCDVVVYTAGNVGLLVGNTDRAAELKFTIPLARSCAQQIKESGFKGIVVNVTNPCDVVTREIANILELPKGHVIGTGTCLDTSRLLSKLSQYTTVNHNSIEAFMIGQHGNYQFCPWSSVYFQGVPLSVLEKKYPQFQFDKEKLMQEVIKAGWLTFKGKQCTEYGIATTVTRMINAVFHDEKVILSATCALDGEYGETDIYAGVPCIIGKDGFEKVLELPLNEEEKKKFHECCEGIRENIKIAEEVQ